MAETGKNAERAASLLKQGKLVAIPTETVYGLAANALSPEAVLSVYEAKQRPFFDPLIIHLHSLESVMRYALLEDSRLRRLAEAFWPGPLTLLLPKKEVIPDIVTAGLERVAVRIPNHALTQQLLQQLDLPLAAPSANPFGYVSPTEAGHVNKQLGDKVAYILDGGPCAVGLESTIIGTEDGDLCVYRLGGLTIEEIEKVAGKVVLKLNQSGNPKAPGQLKSHYAPRKPLLLGDIDILINLHQGKNAAILCFGEEKFEKKGGSVFNLSPGGNLHEAALNLFSFLRQVDESDAELVIGHLLPAQGLGLAINDRLIRASVR